MLDPAFFAATLGLPFDLVKGFFDISLILRSGLPIDPALLWALCAEVKRLYFETAPWAYMSPTLHKAWTSLYMDGTAVNFYLLIFPDEAGT